MFYGWLLPATLLIPLVNEADKYKYAGSPKVYNLAGQTEDNGKNFCPSIFLSSLVGLIKLKEDRLTGEKQIQFYTYRAPHKGMRAKDKPDMLSWAKKWDQASKGRRVAHGMMRRADIC